MLKPIDPTNIGSIDTVQEPIRTCEACGKQTPSSRSINCIMVIGSPGHPDLKPFQCAAEEHWACSPECWVKVAHACIDEHMYIILKYFRGNVGLP